MMIAGIASSAIAVGALVQPFSFERLALVVSGAGLLAFLVTLAAVYRLEGQPVTHSAEPGEPFAAAFASAWRDHPVRRFTIFVFVSMLAFSMQDLILEPFGGLIFGLNPGATTQLSGVHQGGILAGMVLTGIAGTVFGRRRGELEILIAAGCLLSALALAGLALGAAQPLHWPLVANLLVLGLGNGVFSAAAVGAMMGLAGSEGRSGMRMGVWGAAQAVAFGLGGLSGAVIVDVLRTVLGADTIAFQAAFAGEGLLFLVSALLVFRIVRPAALAAQPA
jgi:BCD family chlorophyll transporter-like MFS transporter